MTGTLCPDRVVGGEGLTQEVGFKAEKKNLGRLQPASPLSHGATETAFRHQGTAPSGVAW